MKITLILIASIAILVGIILNGYLVQLYFFSGPLDLATRIKIWIIDIGLIAIGVFILVQRNSGPRYFLGVLRTAGIITIITILMLEVSLRVFFGDLLYIRSNEDQFWQYDANVGWSLKPNISGIFSNGYFKGSVHIDNNGNRKNSATGTYIPGFRNIFFIGDSTTASFEVDDHETVPAVLEQRLRKQGTEINVVNLGVRGYGTDQSVRRALQFADQYKPTDIIYMWVGNDIQDIRLLRRHQRKYGKGVYVRNEPDGVFEPYNFPVPEYANGYLGFVAMDQDCRPVIIEREFPVSLMRPPVPVIQRYSYTARAMVKLEGLIKARQRKSIPKRQKQQEYKNRKAQINHASKLLIKKGAELNRYSFIRAFNLSSLEYGIRERCREYFDAELEFLLAKLRTIPSVQRVHVVFFGEPESFSHARIQKNPNMVAFMHMQQKGVINNFVLLPSLTAPAGVNPKEFRCPHDPHFCEEGNAWIADEIVSNIAF